MSIKTETKKAKTAKKSLSVDRSTTLPLQPRAELNSYSKWVHTEMPYTTYDEAVSAGVNAFGLTGAIVTKADVRAVFPETPRVWLGLSSLSGTYEKRMQGHSSLACSLLVRPDTKTPGVISWGLLRGAFSPGNLGRPGAPAASTVVYPRECGELLGIRGGV